MDIITVVENGINIVFGIKAEKIYLLHLSDKQVEQESLQNFNYCDYRLFEVQVSGKNQNTHRGGKNIFTSEGVDAKFVDLKDYYSQYGRKIEIIQKTADCEIVSHYQFFNNVKALRSWTTVKNVSERKIVLEHVSSFCLYGLCKQSGNDNYNDLFVWQANNSWYCEAQWMRRSIKDYGVYRVNNMHSMARALISNTGSWSSKEYLPMGCVEDALNKSFILWQLECGGSWNCEISSCFNELYVNLFGPSGTENHWYKKLNPCETFESDVAAISFGSDNVENAVNEMIKYRRIIRKDYNDYNSLPIVYNPYMHDAWDYPNADHMYDVAKGSKELGCDVFCIDAGWHDEEDIMKYIGTWRESKTRYPNGLKTTVDKIKKLGMRFGLWLEIETTGIYSPLHNLFDKECFFLRNGEMPINNGRIQLDFSNQRVRDYASGVIDRLMSEYNLHYIKMDYNHDSGAGTEVDSDSYGDGLLKHVRAYKKWLNQIMDKYPDLVIENCGSGGLRFDYYHMADHCINSTSDEVDYKKYPYIITNITTASTPEQLGVWCYPLENGDEEEIVFNVVNSALLRMQLSGYAYKLSGEKQNLLKEGIDYHRKINEIKTDSLPFWPLGFSKFDSDFACFGIKNQKKAYLAVWNMGTVGEKTIPLTNLTIKNLKIGYPANNKLGYCFDGNNLVINFDKDYQARIIEIDLLGE